MNLLDLRNIIKEEVDLLQEGNSDWTVGDLIKLKKELDKVLGKTNSLDNNKAKFSKMLMKYNDRPQGAQLITLWNNGRGAKELRDGLKAMFPKEF
tara:strand:+ start:50 stop:334 length:285 start_codon:yes stop_codon:yes gene_type:complete